VHAIITPYYLAPEYVSSPRPRIVAALVSFPSGPVPPLGERAVAISDLVGRFSHRFVEEGWEDSVEADVPHNGGHRQSQPWCHWNVFGPYRL
jgi:hypothetical protein